MLFSPYILQLIRPMILAYNPFTPLKLSSLN